MTTVGLKAASAAEYSDASSDNCKLYGGPSGPVQWCGPDISATADPILSGEVHLIVSTDTADCAGNGFVNPGSLRFGIFKASATSPNWADELGEIFPNYGTHNFIYQAGATKTPLESIVGTTGSPATAVSYEIILPKSITNGFGAGFKWMVGNSCIGEGPWEASDVAPDAGLYSVALAAPPSAPARPTSVAARPGSTTSATTGPIVVTYVAGANHGATITKFTATCRSSNGGALKSAVHAGATAVPITVGGATLKKLYTCTVTATNAKGTSPASLASGAVIVGAPARVATPAVTRIASGKLKVGFTLLTGAQANGSPLSTPKYTAACTSRNGGIARSATGIGSPLGVVSLTPGKTYTCIVKAHNARGYGAASLPSVARVA